MNREEILTKAAQYVSSDRNNEYGEPEDNFALIADFWGVYLGDMDSDFPDAYDVSMLMALMKIARAAKRPDNADSLIDLAGYAACAGEILAKNRVQKCVEEKQPSSTPWSRVSGAESSR